MFQEQSPHSKCKLKIAKFNFHCFRLPDRLVATVRADNRNELHNHVHAPQSTLIGVFLFFFPRWYACSTLNSNLFHMRLKMYLWTQSKIEFKISRDSINQIPHTHDANHSHIHGMSISTISQYK